MDKFPIAITPLPVMHGEDMIAYGYEFGNVVYLSDVSRILPQTLTYLENLSEITLLIIDCLFLGKDNLTHFTYPSTMKYIRKFKAKLSILTGMSCNFDFIEMNTKFKKIQQQEGINIICPIDGMKISIPSLKISHPTMNHLIQQHCIKI